MLIYHIFVNKPVVQVYMYDIVTAVQILLAQLNYLGIRAEVI